MSKIIITVLTKNYLSQVEEIFFESSTKKDFTSQKERDEFQWKYLGYYIQHFPELCWIALEADKVLGYLVCAPETDTQEFYLIQPHLLKFKDQYERFPAHLHMNMHFESRGKGVGSLLLKHCFKELKTRRVNGLHILTGKDSKNREFYLKLGLTHAVERENIALHGICLD